MADESFHVPFTPRSQETNERVNMHISLADGNRVGSHRSPGFRGTVTDLKTGLRWDVWGAPCALPSCYCDAVVRLAEAEPCPFKVGDQVRHKSGWLGLVHRVECIVCAEEVCKHTRAGKSLVIDQGGHLTPLCRVVDFESAVQPTVLSVWERLSVEL